MKISQIYYMGTEGLKIYPTPKDAETVHYKIWIKRKWWQFWKPKWVYMTEEFFKGK